MKKHNIQLMQEQRQQLQDVISQGGSPSREIMHAQVLLHIDSGEHGPNWSDQRVHEAFGVAVATIFIPRDHIQMSIDEKCWVDAPSIENGLIGCGMHPALTALLIWERKRTSRQKKQMAVLLGVQLQDICKAGKDLIGDINIPTLFEPCVPGNAHSNEPGEFFSSESGLSTPGIGWEIKLLWTQTGTTGFQKIGKLCAALSCFSHLISLALLSSFGV